MFKNPSPGHAISIDDRTSTAVCSCGFKKGCGTYFAALHAAGQHFAATRARTPGQFSAKCQLSTPVLFDELTPEQRDLVEELRRNGYHSRKHSGLVVDVPCQFDTGDRAAFEDHMKVVHGRTIHRKVWSDSETPPRTKPAWKPPKLTEEGTPWVDKAGRTRACRGCGFVVELGRGSTAVIEEHKASCTARDVA